VHILVEKVEAHYKFLTSTLNNSTKVMLDLKWLLKITGSINAVGGRKKLEVDKVKKTGLI